MAKSLLYPRESDPNPWLMPVMSSPNHGLHDPERRKLPALYPKRTIWVDQDAGSSGDGSHGKPLNDIKQVFEDDALECVCQALCCDRIPVCVKGTLRLSVSGDNVTASLSDIANLIDGKNRHYNRALEIRPWADGGRVRLEVQVSLHVPDVKGARIDLNQAVRVVRNLHGVVWRATDVVITLKITCDKTPEEININATAELIGFDACRDMALIDSSIVIDPVVDVISKTVDPTYEWEDGGGGGGGYHWPPLPGTPTPPPYTWPGDPPIYVPPVSYTSRCITRGVNNSAGLIAIRLTCDLRATAYSNVGAIAESVVVLNCPDNFLHTLTVRRNLAHAETTGSGESYTNTDGSHGVRRYYLAAQALAMDIAGCGDGRMTAILGGSSAKALCNAGNTPHHVSAKGLRTTYDVGGFARAAAVGFFGNHVTSFETCDAAPEANAVHPSRYGWRTCPFQSNKDAVFTLCTGGAGACSANDPGFCDGHTCDEVE